MRSLTPTRLGVSELSSIGTSSKAAAVAIDPETGSYYVAVERMNEGVEVDIIRIDPRAPTDFPDVVATVTSPVAAPFLLPSHRHETLDLHYFANDRSLVLLLAGGDIATIQLENGGEVEIVGSVDSGIKAAAWSPDEEQLILVTGEDNLVCMSRLFDLIHEEPLRTEDFGEDGFINVGWGKKSTQFHGSLGKAAAKVETPSGSSSKPNSISHSTDDGLPTITFRGDAAFFAVSSLDSYSSSQIARRQVRIYSQSPGSAPKLSATSESLPGLEGPISWRPSGNLLSGLVRYGYEGGGVGRQGKWDVAMLERNGLRHGGFELREGMEDWKTGRVRGMSWNSDSEILAVWIERVEKDVVQLWSMKNYHYYLKQEIYSHKEGSARFNGIQWHPEQPLILHIFGQDFVQVRHFVWDTYSSRLSMPKDTASVAVVDGRRLLVTPFRTQNVPPPMSSYHLDLPSTPIHVACSSTTDSVALVYHDGRVQSWKLNTRIPEAKSGSKLRGGGKVAAPVLDYEYKLDLPDNAIVRQVAAGSDELAVLSRQADKDVVTIVKDSSEAQIIVLDGHFDRLLWGEQAGWLALDQDGTLLSVNEGDIEIPLCKEPMILDVQSGLVFALSPSGKLYYASLLEPNAPSQTLSSLVTSYTLTSDFVIYTTTAQMSHYASIPVLQKTISGDVVENWESEWETRRIERGALAVTACPSSMSLVLQMPRGNLETVYPRPLVLAVVRRDVLAGSYRDAFVNCRKNRLDLNIIHDLDPKAFLDNLENFIDQVPEVDYLNLFVSALTAEDSSRVLYQDLKRAASSSKPRQDKVNTICNAIRASLEKRDLLKYTETILTTHVCKSPPDYEAGLGLLLQLQKDHPDVVEDAIKYIIFLSEVDKLYDVALGMYDFQLVLMIAQYSQKDPKEYLPFLRELRALDRFEQRFRIDDHLGRRSKALTSLQQAGPSRFDDAASYLARYELYDDAFRLYSDDQEKLPTIYNLYGDYLYDRRDFNDAALAYALASQPQKTLKAYEKAHAWRELFAAAKKQELSQEAISEMVERVTDHLSSRGRHLEASQIYLDYTSDVDSAVTILCQGHDFAEAFRIVSLHSREDLLEQTVLPGLEDAHEGLAEVFDEMEGQLDKELARLEDLRGIRINDPDTFYIVDNEPAYEGVDVATNATTQASAFTRYTVAPTTAFSQTTKMTGQTNKSRHKPSRKRAAGRKGTVDEYEYLLASLGRLVIRVDEKSAEVTTLLRHLLLASTEHRELGRDLQEKVKALRMKLSKGLEDAWSDRTEVLDGVTESGGMGLEGGAGLQKAQEAVPATVSAWSGLGVLS